METNFGDELKRLMEEDPIISLNKAKVVFKQDNLYQDPRYMLLNPDFIQQATQVSQEHIDLCEKYGGSGLWTKKPKLRLVK